MTRYLTRHGMMERTKPALTTRFCLCLLWTMSISPLLFAIEPRTTNVQVDEHTEITIEVFSQPEPKTLLIWQPHEVGLQSVDRELAGALAAAGIEVWLLDLLEASFLPNTANNMDRLSGDGFEALLIQALQSGRPVVVASSGRGAIPLLRGVRQWQLAHPSATGPAGAVLLSPKLFVETPDPGEASRFMPIAKATNLPIVVLQPDKSPWFWKLSDTVSALEQGGSEVYIWPLQGLRDRFYFRPDASDDEQRRTRTFAKQLTTAVNLLTRLPPGARTGVEPIAEEPAIKEGKSERRLRPFRGNPEPPSLALPNLNGGITNLRDLRGQVVLVNFWASWCPPCVHEMPSMQRLMDAMQGQPFTILGVNMAEDETTVRNFLATRVSIRFPIVLDKDGSALKSWGVFAFPTSYVIDKQGQIRYALFGSVEWDEPDIIQTIKSLLVAK